MSESRLDTGESACMLNNESHVMGMRVRICIAMHVLSLSLSKSSKSGNCVCGCTYKMHALGAKYCILPKRDRFINVSGVWNLSYGSYMCFRFIAIPVQIQQEFDSLD